MRNLFFIVISLSLFLFACNEGKSEIESVLHIAETEGSNSSSLVNSSLSNSSGVLHIDDFIDHPAGVLVDVPSSFELSHPDWEYTLVKLFITDEGEKTWELYGFADEDQLTFYRFNNFDKDFSSGTDPDTGGTWTKCSGDGNECRAYTDDEGGVIIIRAD